MNTYFHPIVESKLISLGNRRYYRFLVPTLAWIVLVVAAFAVYMIAFQRSLAKPQGYAILISALIPFFPFGAHKVLLSKTFYATVSYNVNATQFEGLEWAGTRNRPTKVDVLEITCKRDDGKEIRVTFKKERFPGKGLHYSEGDRVLFVRGLKFPYKFPTAPGEKFTCPVCGTTVETEQPICRRCGADFNTKGANA